MFKNHQRNLLLIALLCLPFALPLTTLAAEIAIRPLSEVTQSGPPKLTEIGATEAQLNFISSVPLACNIVYGESKSYGEITNDPNMSSTAIVDHNPILSGLKPDTQYFYRVQGVSADGRVYVGKTSSFRTTKKPLGEKINLASITTGAQVIAVSSNYGNGANDAPWGATSAVDDARSTAWSSNGDGDNAFLEIKLAKMTLLAEAAVWTRTMSDGTAQIFKFTLTTDKGNVFGPFDLPDASKAYHFPLGVEASTIRMDVLESSGGNTGLVEFGVYE